MTISFEIPEDIEEADGLVFLKLGSEADQRALKSVPGAAVLPADTIVSAQARRRLPTGTKKAPCPGDLRPLLGFYLCSPDTTVSAHSAGRQGR